MNKIYKVKKNAAGHSVACSEFAKGHTKKAVLGSLLIAGVLAYQIQRLHNRYIIVIIVVVMIWIAIGVVAMYIIIQLIMN